MRACRCVSESSAGRLSRHGKGGGCFARAGVFAKRHGKTDDVRHVAVCLGRVAPSVRLIGVSHYRLPARHSLPLRYPAAINVDLLDH